MEEKLTFDEAIENHRKMWNWIADETERRKEILSKVDYFKENIIPEEEIPQHRCYCCEYASYLAETTECGPRCELCPVIWYDGCQNVDAPCCDYGVPYKKWLIATDPQRDSYEKAAKIAREIANLPVRDKIKEDL